MKLVSERLQGPAIIRRDTRLANGAVGDLTVASGVTLELNGALSGNLLVCGGATAVIKGKVLGTVFDEGGIVRIAGFVRRLWRTDRPRLV